jgi:DNA-binding CsgD family transcriptional regulator
MNEAQPSAPDSQTALSPPSRLRDRYRLVKWLGQGKMGLVYLARDEMLARDVAVKFLLPEQMKAGERGARFMREARTIAQLTHANIMTLYDVGHQAGWHYMVLEYIAGQDLRAYLTQAGGSLTVAEAVAITRHILVALAFAHKRGVIHRDIKPENIMVTSNGRIKVTDFGLALAQDELRLTQDGTLLGSILYIAPEIFEGQPADPRTDLYAVGILLYELLTGQPPFGGTGLTTLLAQILNTSVLPPSTQVDGLPAALDEFVVNLLAKAPDGRYTTAQAAITALDALIPKTATAVVAKVPDSSPVPYIAAADVVTAVEAERQRLATLLTGDVIEPLNLLLAQATAYEQTLAANPTAHTAVSVLTALARQVWQQAYDLANNLHSAVLESLGLEPALETLASQISRAHGVQISLHLGRMSQRLPAHLELALFRLTQAATDRAVHQAHASHVTLTLRQQPEALLFRFVDNSTGTTSTAALDAARHQLEQLGGRVSLTYRDTGLDLTIVFPLYDPDALTPREMEVLQLLAEGLSNKEIAQRLTISPRTVNFHLDNIYVKLGVNSRTEAAVIALRQGWSIAPRA